MEVLNAIDQKKETFLSGIASACEAPLSTHFPKLRVAALTTLAELEVPTTRNEMWKYTRVSRVIGKAWKAGAKSTSNQHMAIQEVDAWKLIFVNGHFNAELSEIPAITGLTIMPMTEAASQGKLDATFASLTKQDSDWFEALNLAFATDGLYVHVESNHQIDKPLYMVHLIEGDAVGVVSRNFISVDEGAALTVIQHTTAQTGTTAYVNVMNELMIAKNAELHFEKIQDESGEVYEHATEWAHQARDSRFDIRTITLQGHWVRNNLNIEVNGENCSTNLYGSYMPNGKEHIDNHTMVDHLIPHCESNEVYKGIVNDKATAVFNGKVFVRPDAQKTNAFQQNANIVLSEDAEMYSKPELEIYADDVKCSHGSTTGQFDEEAVYYLRARGLSENSARMLLVQAFVGDIMDAISSDAVRTYCLSKLQERAGA